MRSGQLKVFGDVNAGGLEKLSHFPRGTLSFATWGEAHRR